MQHPILGCIKLMYLCMLDYDHSPAPPTVLCPLHEYVPVVSTMGVITLRVEGVGVGPVCPYTVMLGCSFMSAQMVPGHLIHIPTAHPF